MSETTTAYANKDELARALDWSKPTLDSYLKDHPDAPIVRRGSNGVEWQFDVAEFMGFVARANVAEEAALAAKRAELDKWALPLGLDPKNGSARDVVSMLRANKLAKEAGLLIPVSEMRQKCLPVLAKVGRFLDNLPAMLGRKFQLPEAVVRAMEKMLAEQREQLVRDIQETFADAPPEVMRSGTHD